MMNSFCRRLQACLINNNKALMKRLIVNSTRATYREMRFRSTHLQQDAVASRFELLSLNRSRVLAPAHLYAQRSIWMSSVRSSESQTVKSPSFPESVAQGDLKWLKKVGESVRVDEVVAEIETDKTMIPVPSPFNGVISELLVADGAKVGGHQEVFKLQVGDAAAAPTPAKVAAAPAQPTVAAPPVAAAPQPQVGGLRRPPPAVGAAAPASAPSAVVSAAPSVSSPAARADNQQAGAKPVPKTLPVGAGQQKITPGVERIFGTRGEHRVRMSRLRQRIAERLKEAQNTCAMLTTFNEVDMTGVLEMRKRYGDAFLKKHGIKLGIMGPFVKAAAYALDQMPVVNAVIDNNEIVYRDYIDISVAVSAPRGLVVPVIRGVESMNYVDIERAIATLSEKARKETLTLDEMEGGTFTVSNGGVFGSLISTPIINLPQSAILGMHATFDRPVAINGKVEIRPMMYITMTYDHRLIDGREAVTFLRTIKTAVEDPRVLQLDL